MKGMTHVIPPIRMAGFYHLVAPVILLERLTIDTSWLDCATTNSPRNLCLWFGDATVATACSPLPGEIVPTLLPENVYPLEDHSGNVEPTGPSKALK
jgi:hypothetical protein